MESHVENRVENVLSSGERETKREKAEPAKNQLGYCVGSDRDSKGGTGGRGL